MTRTEKNEIIKWTKDLSDQQLETEYYKAVYDCLGSQTEQMYELGYDIADIIEREKFEDYLCDRADVLEAICQERGIELWKEKETNNESDKDTVR